MANYYPQNEQALIENINAANDAGSGTIYLNPSQVYSFSNDYQDSYAALPEIDGYITIIGNNATLERSTVAGTPNFSFFLLAESSRLRLEDLTLKNGDTSDGGAIGLYEDYAQLELIACTILNNNTDTSGGAIFAKGAQQTITIEKCHFEDNTAPGTGGGAIYMANQFSSEFPKLRIKDSVFENNSADDVGGALYLVDIEAYIRTSQFIGNEAERGGAIEAGDHGWYHFTDCLFNNNEATSYEGGAIYSGAGAYELSLLGCEFIDNHAADYATVHVMLIDRVDEVGVCKIINCVFKDNTVGGGGSGNPAVLDYSSDDESRLIVRDSVFSGNVNQSDADEPIMDFFLQDGQNSFYNNCWNGAIITDNVVTHPQLGDGCAPRVIDNQVLPDVGPSKNQGKHLAMVTTNDSNQTGFPISLRLAEKRQHKTDISLNTAMGILSFTRSYRQSTQDERDFMGRGWSHNHRRVLEHDSTNDPDTITVETAQSKIYFHKEATLSGGIVRYARAGGSTAYIEEDTGAGTYTLFASDKSEYYFAEVLDSTHWLITKHTLPTGDVWSYQYTTGDLILVYDGTNASSYDWGLQFAYYSGQDRCRCFQEWQALACRAPRYNKFKHYARRCIH